LCVYGRYNLLVPSPRSEFIKERSAEASDVVIKIKPVTDLELVGNRLYACACRNAVKWMDGRLVGFGLSLSFPEVNQ
jgi:hypothetical protein